MSTKRILIATLALVSITLSAYFVYQQFFKREKMDLSKLGSGCNYAGECGNIVAVNCRAEVDGPFYYIDKESEVIIGYCGGYCMGGGQGKYCQNCPPKDWNCE